MLRRGATVERSSFIAEGPEFNSDVGISDIYFSSPYSPSAQSGL
jgi:hypothetical protein